MYGLDYLKTIEKNKLVINGLRFEKIKSYIFATILIVYGLFLACFIFIRQLANNPSLEDYIVAIIFSSIMILIAFVGSKRLINRNKLREFVIYQNKDTTQKLIIEAANNLKWDIIELNPNFIILKTKYNLINASQTVSLIFFPENRLLFNSIHWPNDFIRPANFDENYNTLKKEYLKLEKEIKTFD
jgi:hypothetical protein